MDITKLKALKDKSGMSFQGISDSSGVPMSTVTRIFRGEGSPRFDDIAAIVMVLRGSLDDLVGLKPPATGNEKAQEELIELYKKQIEVIQQESAVKVAFLKEQLLIRDKYLAEKNEMIKELVSDVLRTKREK